MMAHKYFDGFNSHEFMKLEKNEKFNLKKKFLEIKLFGLVFGFPRKPNYFSWEMSLTPALKYPQLM